jgi:hypothetical protein
LTSNFAVVLILIFTFPFTVNPRYTSPDSSLFASYPACVVFAHLHPFLIHLEKALTIRCQDQHETTSTPSVAPPDVTSKTQRKAQWISQDGIPKPDPHQEVEVDEVDHQVEGEEVGADHQEIGEGAVRVVLLNVLVNLGESRRRASTQDL